MSQSLAKVVVHIVHSTKHRQPCIANQEEHHKRISFQDEFRELCNRHRIAIDERYVWD